VGEPEEVVVAVLFLLSDEAAWISGAVLPVDGGLLAGNGPMAREILGEDRADA
jgi:NAD(P)-dependent dehydrogenase (short-subunit alcohol dehydrogenase family)